jgi:hypothetical protein
MISIVSIFLLNANPSLWLCTTLCLTTTPQPVSKGSRAVTTIAAHAAQSIAALSGLALLPCPLARYPIELGWRTSTQRDSLVLKVREAIVGSSYRGVPKTGTTVHVQIIWRPSAD